MMVLQCKLTFFVTISRSQQVLMTVGVHPREGIKVTAPENCLSLKPVGVHDTGWVVETLGHI